MLFELTGGFAIFKVLNEYKLFTPQNFHKEFSTAEKARKLLKLKYFFAFKTVDDAIESAVCAVQGKINPFLMEVLKNHVTMEGAETLAVLDVKLGHAIRSELNMPCVSSSAIVELGRCIRSNMDILLGELSKDLQSMRAEVAHGLAGYKLNEKLSKRVK